MSRIDIRTGDGGEASRKLASATIFGGIAWWLWPGPEDHWQQAILAGISGLGAVSSAAGAAIALAKDFRLRRDITRSQVTSDDHGSAREATWDEICAAGMNDPANGTMLGLYHGLPVFAPAIAPFKLIEMPPGGGKTTRLVLGSIIHQAFLGKSIVIADPKTELAPMLTPALKKLGFNVWCINPAKRHLDFCPDVEINPYEAVLAAAYAEDEVRLDTVKRAADLAALHLPDGADGNKKNAYFMDGARRCITIAVLYLALTNPACCTPSDVFALLNDPEAFLKALKFIRRGFETAVIGDPIVAFMKTEAAGLLHLAKKNKGDNFASFVQWATQTLLTFNQAGRLGGYGRTAVHAISQARDEQIIIFIMTPLSHARDFAPLISAVNYNILAAAKDNPAGHPLHIVGEEALNYRFGDLVSDLETMRGLKMTADFYIQSFQGLERIYGRDAAAAIDAYSAVKIYSALNSYARAKHVSDMLAEETIRKQDYSYRNVATDLGVSSRELGRRLMTPDEILAMPRGEAWALVQGMRPMRLQLVPAGQVADWRAWAQSRGEDFAATSASTSMTPKQSAP